MPPTSTAPSGPKGEDPKDGATRALAMALATGLGSGLLPKAPGTFGSTLAIPIFVLFSPLAFWLQIVTWLGLLAVGIWAADEAGRAYGVEDDGRIVIDEVVGQWLTLLPLVPLGAAAPGIWSPGSWSAPVSFGLLVTGFVAFRCFDIAKVGPVGWAERRFQGGLGVMMDDVVAGAFGAVVVVLAALGVVAMGLVDFGGGAA